MDWNIKVENQEQFIEVLEYFKSQGKNVGDCHFSDYIYKTSNTYTLMRIGDGEEWDWGYNGFDSGGYSPSKRITWEEFQKIKNPLPEKWCIKVDKSKPEIAQWFNNNSQTGIKAYHTTSIDYFHYPAIQVGNQLYHHLEKNRDYTEITLEQFREQILKIKNMKIIGYKAPLDLFEGHIKKGETLILNTCGKLYRKNSGETSFYGLPRELVEAWEPVYEPEYKVVMIGNPKRAARVYSDKVEVIDGAGDIRTFSIEDIKTLKNSFNTFVRIGGFDSFPTTMRVGCGQGTELKEKDLDNLISNI